jgi:hypothetical protein
MIAKGPKNGVPMYHYDVETVILFFFAKFVHFLGIIGES